LISPRPLTGSAPGWQGNLEIHASKSAGDRARVRAAMGGACRSSARERQVPSGTINDEVRQSLARNLDLEDTRLDY